jgi:hypothetical protein
MTLTDPESSSVCNSEAVRRGPGADRLIGIGDIRALFTPGRTAARELNPRLTPGGHPLAGRLAARAKEACAEQEAGPSPLGLIFPSPAGKHWRSSNFSRNVLKGACLAAGWRDCHGDGRRTRHSPRHAFCITAMHGEARGDRRVADGRGCQLPDHAGRPRRRQRRRP